ncbi:hypothetical protein ACFY12_29830 [Streptomyces sp. NPDC001339]|uniref:hypothetical protein n=1 Tax=Streptomyces sp. NPDC001339 TaxID=3364563 RepID=UPI0036BBC9DA
MKRLTGYAVIGCALLPACVACTSGEGGITPSALPSPSSAEPSRLLQLPALDLADDPLTEQDDSAHSGKRRVIGEVHNGLDRIIIYTTGQKCGLATTRKGDRKNLSVHVLTAWPKDGTHETTRLPYGPYLNSSAKGSHGTWANLSCGKDAMVMKFFSPDISKTSKPRGSLDVIQPQNTESPVSIVVGTREIREKLSAALKTHS